MTSKEVIVQTQKINEKVSRNIVINPNDISFGVLTFTKKDGKIYKFKKSHTLENSEWKIKKRTEPKVFCDLHDVGDPECIFSIQELKEVVLTADRYSREKFANTLEELIYLYLADPFELDYLNAIGFIDEIWEMNSGYNDWINEELDDNPCAGNILYQLRVDARMKATSRLVGLHGDSYNLSQMIINLFDKSAITHMYFQIGETPNGANASTLHTTVTLNENYLKTATQLAIARTMIHEMVHVYLEVNYKTHYPDVRDQNIHNYLRSYFNIHYKGMDYERAHHEFMGLFVEEMAASLRDWDMRYGTKTDLGIDYYRSQAYGGLFQVNEYGRIIDETNAFKQLVPDPKDRQNIANKVMNEQNNNRNAKGSDCP